MKKGWRIIIVIVLVVALLGAVCVGVGLMTGADKDLIKSVVEDRCHVAAWLAHCQDTLLPELKATVMSWLNTVFAV